VSQSTVGRHRAPGRYNPLNELGTVVGRTSQPLAKSSALLAASGGLVAAIALPASAAQGDASTTSGQGTDARAVSAPVAVTAPKTAPAEVTAEVKAFGAQDVVAVAKPVGLRPWQIEARRERDARIQAEREEAEREEAEREEAQRREQAAQAAAAQPRAEAPASRSNDRAAAPAPAQPAAKPAAAPANDAPAAGGVLAIAAQFAGLPYVYGGATPAGFDCSGFTMYVFGKAGISLPRTAAAQQAAVTPVSDPQPGDLVFFGSPAWHVGIYAGNGMMWDSPRTGSVVSKRPVFGGVSGYGRP